MDANDVFMKLRPQTIEAIIKDYQKQLKSFDDFMIISSKPDPRDDPKTFRMLRDLELLAVSIYNQHLNVEEILPYKVCDKTEEYIK